MLFGLFASAADEQVATVEHFLLHRLLWWLLLLLSSLWSAMLLLQSGAADATICLSIVLAGNMFEAPNETGELRSGDVAGSIRRAVCHSYGLPDDIVLAGRPHLRSNERVCKGRAEASAHEIVLVDVDLVDAFEREADESDRVAAAVDTID